MLWINQPTASHRPVSFYKFVFSDYLYCLIIIVFIYQMNQQQELKLQYMPMTFNFDNFGQFQTIKKEQGDVNKWSLLQNHWYITFLKHHTWIYNREVLTLSCRISSKLASLIKTKDKHQINKHHSRLVQKYKSLEDLIKNQQQQIQLLANDNQILLQRLNEISQQIITEKINDKKQQNIEKIRIRHISNKKHTLMASLSPTELKEFTQLMQIKQSLEYFQHPFADPPRGLLTCSTWNYYEDYMYFTYIKRNLDKLQNNKIIKKDWYVFNLLSVLIKTKGRNDVVHHHYELIRQFQSINNMMHYFQVQVIKCIQANPRELKELKMYNQYIDQFIEKERIVQGLSKDLQVKYLQNPVLLQKLKIKKYQIESQVKIQDNGQYQIIKFQTSQNLKSSSVKSQMSSICEYNINGKINKEQILKSNSDSSKEELIKIEQQLRD